MLGTIASAQDADKGKPDLSGWPEASEKAAKEMMGKYGQNTTGPTKAEVMKKMKDKSKG